MQTIFNPFLVFMKKNQFEKELPRLPPFSVLRRWSSQGFFFKRNHFCNRSWFSSSKFLFMFLCPCITDPGGVLRSRRRSSLSSLRMLSAISWGAWLVSDFQRDCHSHHGIATRTDLHATPGIFRPTATALSTATTTSTLSRRGAEVIHANLRFAIWKRKCS